VPNHAAQAAALNSLIPGEKAAMRKTFLHVGFPKTGTTTLDAQVFPRLSGVRYLGTLQREQPLRRLFEVDLLSKDRLEYDAPAVHQELWTAIRQACGDDPRPLLFSNHSLTFTWTNHIDRLTVAERLRELFDDAEILIVVRHQIEMLESMYRHLLTNGVYLSFPTFLKGLEREFHRSPLPQLKFCEVVRMYERMFGDKRVHVYCYEDFAQRPDAFFRQLFAVLQVNEAVPQHTVENVSLGAAALAFKRLVNRWAPHAMGRPPFFPSRRATGAAIDPANFQHRYRKWTNQAARRIDQMLPWCGKARLLYPPGVREWIETLYAASNRELAACRGLPLEQYGYPGFNGTGR
jgi:hypothetical protein